MLLLLVLLFVVVVVVVVVDVVVCIVVVVVVVDNDECHHRDIRFATATVYRVVLQKFQEPYLVFRTNPNVPFGR